MDFSGKKSVKNPWEETLNPFSHIIFAWVLPLFKKGFSKELTINDIYDSPKSHRSKECAEHLQKEWEDEKVKAKSSGSKPRLWKSIAKVHRFYIFIYTAVLMVDELIVRVLQPIYLRLLVRSFHESSKSTKTDQIIYASVVCLASLFHDLVMHQCVFLMYRIGLSCRTACSSLIYRKSMRLESSSSEESSTGHLMNLLSNDVSRFDVHMLSIPYILIGPIQLAILLYFLYQEMGPSAFAGAAFIFLIAPTQLLNGKLAGKFRGEVAAKTDERSRIMNEIVIAIRVIKMYAWEKPFAKIISGIRSLEVNKLSKRAYLRGFFLSLYTFSTRLTAFFVIMTYVLLGNEISADKAFFTVAISLTIVESMVFYLSNGMSALGEILVSVGRIEKFLLLREQDASNYEEIKDKNNFLLNLNGNEGEKIEKVEIEEAGKVKAENVIASWPNAPKVTLSDVNFNFEGDKLVMIVGPVGSGKTSLLHLLMNELMVSQGRVKCEGDLSYASQESWIFTGNIRENILFGEPFNSPHYEKVVEACALKDDFHQLPNGDMTIVGERGITLSGGQKARVNLARSLYRNSSIYLMDDPLSAVDSRVSQHIFHKCVQKHLGGRLRILVTHQLQYLPYADYLLLLNDGRIQAQGTYADLVSSGVDFVSLISAKAEAGGGEGNQRKMSGVKATDQDTGDFLGDYEKVEDNGEGQVEGSVTLSTYWSYIKTAKSPLALLFLISMFIISQLLLTSSEYWLSFWTDAEERKNGENSEALTKWLMRVKKQNLTREGVEVLPTDRYLNEEVYLWVYTGLVIALFTFCLTRAATFFNYTLKISTNLHKKMFESLVRAPTKFFDDNPSGRIMNRFTKDIGSIDELLPPAFFDSLDYFLQMLGVIAVLIVSNYYLSIPTLIVCIIFWFLRIVFIRTSRDIKRLESIWKSPVFTHVAASMQGLTTIRALKAQQILISQFDDKQDVHTATWFAFISTARCFAVWAETTGIIFLTIVTFSFLLFATGSSGGTVGLVITSTLSLTVNVQWAIRQSAETENYMTCVERALEYTKLTPEAPLQSSKDKSPPANWPSGGEIKFQNVFLSYEDKDVLKNLNFEIKSKEKIGIVGRTGAGKSSIISALFRLTEPRGNIYIDGIKTSEIGLYDLRKNISIIPQEPVLFPGTIRYNLDPFDQFNDQELCTVLNEVQLGQVVSALDSPVSHGGSNFSVGQRQLICLARAILKQNRVIVLDEATANVDPRTDEFIQKTIRMKFGDCSIITIAHRLQSVMDCDRILVLEQGNIMEYDHPHVLLQNENGFLSKLAAHTGKASNELLKTLAKHHFTKNC